MIYTQLLFRAALIRGHVRVDPKECSVVITPVFSFISSALTFDDQTGLRVIRKKKPDCSQAIGESLNETPFVVVAVYVPIR